MRKLDLLRDWMTAALPFLKRNPEALHLFAEEGVIACTGVGGGLSFEYRYTAILQLWDFAGEPSGIIVPLLAWASRYQPELLKSYAKNPAVIAFRVEVLDAHKSDVELRMELTERVQVERRNDSTGLDYQVLPEPFEDVSGIRHWTLWLGAEKLAEWDAPDGATFP